MMEVSRAELYKLVWSHPIREIARHYGVNAVRLGQLCDAYDIARPPLGYWQKFEHGKAPHQGALRSVKFSPDEIVTLKTKGQRQTNQ